MNNKKLLIIMSNADPEKPESCYVPIFQATVAAALSHDVEVIFTGLSRQLSVVNVAQQTEINLESHQTIYDIIKEAYHAGVSFKACSNSLKLASQELIEEVDERVGAAYVIAEAMDKRTITFTY